MKTVREMNQTQQTSEELSFSSLGIRHDLTAKDLSAALAEKGNQNDLSGAGALLARVHSKVISALKSDSMQTSEALEFAKVFEDFATKIDLQSKESAPRIHAKIVSMAGNLRNEAERVAAVKEGLEGVDVNILIDSQLFGKESKPNIHEIRILPELKEKINKRLGKVDILSNNFNPHPSQNKIFLDPLSPKLGEKFYSPLTSLLPRDESGSMIGERSGLEKMRILENLWGNNSYPNNIPPEEIIYDFEMQKKPLNSKPSIPPHDELIRPITPSSFKVEPPLHSYNLKGFNPASKEITTIFLNIAQIKDLLTQAAEQNSEAMTSLLQAFGNDTAALDSELQRVAGAIHKNKPYLTDTGAGSEADIYSDKDGNPTEALGALYTVVSAAISQMPKYEFKSEPQIVKVQDVSISKECDLENPLLKSLLIFKTGNVAIDITSLSKTDLNALKELQGVTVDGDTRAALKNTSFVATIDYLRKLDLNSFFKAFNETNM